MRPVTFTCHETVPLSPDAIAGQILDLANWPNFTGYGGLPGIRAATFETRTPYVVGTRIRVTNTDGSRHVEEVVEWRPPDRLCLRFGDFSPPVSRLATHFEEVWEFRPRDEQTLVIRTFHLHPRSGLTRVALWLISFLLKRAVLRHLRQLRDHSPAPRGSS